VATSGYQAKWALLRSPLEWREVARCLLVAGVSVVFLSVYGALGMWLGRNPEAAPYYDWDFFPTFQRMVGVFILAWLVLLGTGGLMLRRRKASSRALVHATIQLYSAGNAVGAVCAGTVTSPHALVLMSGAMVGFFLFDRRAVLLGLLTATLVLVAGTVAAALGAMSYAPLLAGPPYVDGRISTWWWGLNGLVALSVGGVALAMFVHLMARLRDREEKLLAASRTDLLTGLANRRHFMEAFERELRRSRRHGRSLGCILFDMDHFKRINDTYGHLAGDRVLQAAARILGDHLRAGDLLARWGGEEFVALLPDTDHAGSLAMAERCRLALASTPIDVGDETLHVTASLGLACFPQHDVLRCDDLLRLADGALYEAKAQGRNRTVSAGGEEVPVGRADPAKAPSVAAEFPPRAAEGKATG
jgi:diguanylate cyclase (GGDEF)-like protein